MAQWLFTCETYDILIHVLDFGRGNENNVIVYSTISGLKKTILKNLKIMIIGNNMT